MERAPHTRPEVETVRPAASAERRRAIIPRWLYSMKFAIWIAVALALASVFGVLVQEFYPVRNQAEAQLLAERWPAPAVRAFFFLNLQDPFRAVWFRTLLGALAASLIVCSARRFRSALRQAFLLRPVREPRALQMLQNSAIVHHVSPELFDDVIGHLRRRFYRGTVERRPDEYVAAMHQGGVSRTGPVLLHLGILALVFGGLMTSLVGRKSYLQVSPGQEQAIEHSPYTVRVDDFQIERNDAGMIKQYRSQISMLQDGVEVARQEISVNHPLRHAGTNIYQASYGANPDRATHLAFAIRPQETADGATGEASPHGGSMHGSGAHAGVDADAQPVAGTTIQATMDATYPVPGFPGWEFRVARFFGHLVLSSEGPVNGGRDFANPAAQIEILHDGQPAGTQWAFLQFPAMARADLPFVIEMHDAAPEMFTGLEVNTNPGAPLVWLGFGISTLGLLLSFLMQHRCVFLLSRPSERGWTVWIAGRSDRERVRFAQDFERLMDRVRASARRFRVGRGNASGPDADPIESSSSQALVSPSA
jgi:cytochrome c biogenesis protein